MADDNSGTGNLDEGTENAALGEALAAEHAAVWGYGVVGTALGPEARPVAAASEAAHRDVRDQLVTLLAGRNAETPRAEGGYELPFPVLSEVDAAALAVVLEQGVEAAWVRVLDQAAERSTREFAAGALTAAEVRAVSWRSTAGQTPVTSAFPGLPES